MNDLAGPALRGDVLPPVRGGIEGGPSERQQASNPNLRLTAIESIRSGDQVIGHEGLPNVVRRAIVKTYRGGMVCLRQDHSDVPVWLTGDHRVLAKLRPRTLGGRRDWSGSPEWHAERRRELRQEATVAERKLWNVLRGSSTGFKFRRQHSLGPYIADFYSRDAHLVVEVDGEWHYTAEGREHDRRRNVYMRELGVEVLRVPVTELDDNLDGVWLGIQNQCRLRNESISGALWVQAGSILPGDIVFAIDDRCVGGENVELTAATIVAVDMEWSEETVYDLEVDTAHSFVTEVGVVHNCGGPTQVGEQGKHNAVNHPPSIPPRTGGGFSPAKRGDRAVGLHRIPGFRLALRLRRRTSSFPPFAGGLRGGVQTTPDLQQQDSGPSIL